MASLKKAGVMLALCGVSWVAMAQTPSILLEACNAMEPASKRLECLRAASGQRDQAAASYGSPSPAHGTSAQRQSFASTTTAAAPRATGGQTCFTGPRGGTYTITASGRKNYSGC
jgi:hypothetical protein